MKKLIIAFFFIMQTITAQKVVKETVLDLPDMGNYFPTTLLTATLNEDATKLVFDYKFNRLLYVAKVDSYFKKPDFQQVDVYKVGEYAVQVDDMSKNEFKQMLIHPFSHEENTQVFFNLTGINNTANSHPIKYGIDDASKVFPSLSKFDSINSETNYCVIRVKKKSPYIICQNTKTFFDWKKGKIGQVEKFVNKESHMPEFKDYYSSSIAPIGLDNVGFQWFQHKSDRAKYKMVVYNADTKKITVNDYDFKVPRKIRLASQIVYDENIKPVGILSIFGYHRKGKKNERYLSGNQA